MKKKSAIEGYAQVGNTFALSCTVFKDVEKAIAQVEDGKTVVEGLEAKTSRPVKIKSLSTE